MVEISFRMMTVLLLAGVFTLGGVAGMFVHATGEEVVTSTFMKMISHTEYRFAEQGQIVARLVNYQGDAVVVDNCTATILYPDKSLFVDSALMSNTGNISGDHYYEFTTPANGPEGVYEYQATCAYTVGAETRTKSVTNSFHLSGAFNQVLGNLSVVTSNQEQMNITLNEISQNLGAINLSEMSAKLDTINATTTSTYQYLTGTLTTKVDQALTLLGVMNATVNRIEVNTVEINDTVSQILTNQQDEVHMTTFSG